jgi:deazaflavin-dependent oxidoreductase (nitroreductase family)
MDAPSSQPQRAPQRREIAGSPQRFAARLHFIPRLIRPLQHSIVRLFRRYFEQSSGWVLLTTTGRRTGLPREVLLPCERWGDALLIISTYGWQSDWIRNLRRHPQVQVTCAGWVLPAQAEIITDLEAKRAIVAAHPFFVPAPFAVLNFLHRTLFRPLWVPVFSWWIRSRPVVLIRSRR